MQQDLLQVLFPKLKIIVFVATKVSSMQNSTESFFSCCKNAQNAETQKRNELGGASSAWEDKNLEREFSNQKLQSLEIVERGRNV